MPQSSNNNFTITRQNFLEWYFESGGNEENMSIKADLIERVISDLKEHYKTSITVEDIFSSCNTDDIDLIYIDSIESNEHCKKLGDLNIPYILKLNYY